MALFTNINQLLLVVSLESIESEFFQKDKFKVTHRACCIEAYWVTTVINPAVCEDDHPLFKTPQFTQSCQTLRENLVVPLRPL